MTRARVVVLGGGLAGITAALRCVDRGFDVTLVEARSALGGATYSFRRDGLVVDTGQHVVLRCYSAYAALLRRLGVLDGIAMQRRFRVPVLAARQRPSVLERWELPSPAHLTPALLRNRALSPRQRARAARTALALRRLDPADPALDDKSFGTWLAEQHESARSVRALWGLLAVAALNAEPAEASLALAAKVFRTGLLDTVTGGDIGVPVRPLSELHGTAAYRTLVSAGASVRLNSKARAVYRFDTTFRVAVRDRNGEGHVEGDSLVVAVPHRAAAALLGPLPLPEARTWARLSASPIVNVHVRYDRRVTELPMAAVLDSPVQWVFDRTSASGARQGQYLALSLSAANDYIDERTASLRDIFVPALDEVFPGAKRALVRDFFVTREPRATFLQAPGVQAIRPVAGTAIPGLVLAGAWTATGWPDTTEGAVRSGDQAAELVTRTTPNRAVARR